MTKKIYYLRDFRILITSISYNLSIRDFPKFFMFLSKAKMRTITIYILILKTKGRSGKGGMVGAIVHVVNPRIQSESNGENKNSIAFPEAVRKLVPTG